MKKIECPAVSLTAALTPLTEVMLRIKWSANIPKKAIKKIANDLRNEKIDFPPDVKIREDGFAMCESSNTFVLFDSIGLNIIIHYNNTPKKPLNVSDESLISFFTFCEHFGFIRHKKCLEEVKIIQGSYAPFGNSIPSSPLRAYYIITEKCNLNCKHCCNEKKHINKKELSTKQAKKMLKNLSAANVFEIVFTGGEPTIRNDLAELVSYTRELGMIPVVTTNGFKTNLVDIDQYKNAGLKHVQLSLDGSTPDIHDSFRGVDGSFEEVMHAIDLYKKRDFIVSIGIVITRHNKNDIENIIRLLIRKNILHISLMEFIPIGYGKSAYENLQPTNKDYKEIYRNMTHIRRQQSEIKIAYQSPIPYLFKSNANSKYPFEATRVSCGAGFETVDIDPYGEAYACGALMSKDFYIGNLLSDKIEDLWNDSKGLQNWRSLSEIQGKCKHCDVSALCVNGCRAVLLGTSESLESPNPNCWYMNRK